MAYTLAQSITKVRELLNEPISGFFSDTEITGWIQEAVIDISTKLLCVTAIDTITLVTDQYKYYSSDESWIGDCLKPKSVWYDSSTGPVSLQMITARQFGHNTMRDAEPKYYHYDSTLRYFFILPIPDSTINGDTVSVIYSYETDDITALKDEHQPLAFLFATAKGRLKERLYGESNSLMQQYINFIIYERQDKFNLGVEPTSDFKVP